MCTWVPFLLVEEGDNLWSGHQVAFMGIGKAILAFSMLLTPIIGIINDETISYLGRRRFWFISGVILIAIGVLTCAVASLIWLSPVRAVPVPLSRRAAAGRAELLANFLGGAVWGVFRENANCGDPPGTLPGNLPGNLRVPSGYPVHFAGA